MNWILFVLIHAGSLSHNDDVAINATRMYQQNACEAAGKLAASKLRTSVQSVDWFCVHDAEKAS